MGSRRRRFSCPRLGTDLLLNPPLGFTVEARRLTIPATLMRVAFSVEIILSDCSRHLTTRYLHPQSYQG